MDIKNLNIGTRLGMAFGVMLVLLVLVAALAVVNMGRLNGTTDALVKSDWVKAKLANVALDSARGSIGRVFQAVAADDPKETATAHERLQANTAKFDAALAELAPLLVDPEGKGLLEKARAARQRYVAAYSKVLALLKEGDRAAAGKQAYGETYTELHAFAGALRDQVDYQEKRFDLAGADSAAVYANARMVTLALSLAAIFVGVGFGLWITRSITVPIVAALRIAQTVAAGDLSGHFDASAGDETGQLLRALKEMNDSLHDIVGRVRKGSDAMATASGEIASGNLDLSGRTEEQASSLEETASSMEQMTSTVRQNADNARQANVLAASAAQVAQRGGAVVAQVVSTMDEINASSRKIVDIISVIDGIAFQTNILALNAAVEAARAGEQGRGFAVVASEVRNLAQRSAAAAKEIKTLIGDSVDKVDYGARLVAQAGSTMDEIVASVQRVTDIMTEISSASHEQESGIEQINQAIGQMDSVTQQNAALVEQAAAAAAQLQEQAAGLASVVSVFTLSATAQAPHARAPALRAKPRAMRPALAR